MPRTRRYIFNTLTVVSLLLMVGTVGLWVDSYWHLIMVRIRGPLNITYETAIEEGWSVFNLFDLNQTHVDSGMELDVPYSFDIDVMADSNDAGMQFWFDDFWNTFAGPGFGFDYSAGDGTSKRHFYINGGIHLVWVVIPFTSSPRSGYTNGTKEENSAPPPAHSAAMI